MSQQVKIRLDDATADRLNNQAAQQGISFNSLCKIILVSTASHLKDDVLLVSPRRLLLQLDVVASCLRSLEKKINSNSGEHQP